MRFIEHRITSTQSLMTDKQTWRMEAVFGYQNSMDFHWNCMGMIKNPFSCLQMFAIKTQWVNKLPLHSMARVAGTLVFIRSHLKHKSLLNVYFIFICWNIPYQMQNMFVISRSLEFFNLIRCELFAYFICECSIPQAFLPLPISIAAYLILSLCECLRGWLSRSLTHSWARIDGTIFIG